MLLHVVEEDENEGEEPEVVVVDHRTSSSSSPRPTTIISPAIILSSPPVADAPILEPPVLLAATTPSMTPDLSSSSFYGGVAQPPSFRKVVFSSLFWGAVIGVFIGLCFGLCIAWLLDPSSSLASPQGATSSTSNSTSDGTITSDGRASLTEILTSFDVGLMRGGSRAGFWIKEQISLADDPLQTKLLPVYCYRTRKMGRAIWIVSGIHGEEPAGPNALSREVKYLASLASDSGLAIVLLPLNNPIGYLTGRRYCDGVNSVSDSDWLIRNTAVAALRQARDLARFVVQLSRSYPPAFSLDLHEDCLQSVVSDTRSYIYSQGRYGVQDKVAQIAVRVLTEAGFPPLLNGTTRFGERIINGIVGASEDGSIDELLSADSVYNVTDAMEPPPGDRSQLTRVPGPHAPSVIVTETPGSAPLEERIKAQQKVVRSLGEMWAAATRP